MEDQDELKVEMKMALGFAKAMLEAKGEFPPLLLLSRGDGENMAIGGPPLTDQSTKESVTGMFAMAARAWGATQAMLIVDSYYVRYPTDELPPSPDHFVPPSEDPRASEAIVVTAFRTDADDVGYLCPYHHTPEGIVFDKEEELPVGTGGDSGTIPTVFHRALSMSDEQVARVMANAPVNGGINSAHEFLLMLQGMGFMVMS